MEFDISDLVGCGIEAGLLNGRGIILNANHSPCPAGKRQTEVAHTTEEIKHFLVALKIEQRQHMTDHRSILIRVNLDKPTRTIA